MVVEAGLARPGAIGLLAPAGERDQDRVALGVAASDRARHLVPVHVRHTDVEQDEGGIELLENCQSLPPRVGDPHFGVGILEQHAEAVRGILVVVHDQDPLAGETASGRLLLGHGGGRGRQRQLEREAGAPPRPLARCPDRTAVHFGEAARDGQPDAEAFRL